MTTLSATDYFSRLTETADPFLDQLCDIREELAEAKKFADADLAEAQKIATEAEYSLWFSEELIKLRQAAGPESITPRTLNPNTVNDAELSRTGLRLRQMLQNPALTLLARQLRGLRLQLEIYKSALNREMPPQAAEIEAPTAQDHA